MIVQSVLISKDEYSLDQAKSWLEAHDYQTGVDEKQDSFRFRQREPKDFNPQSFRTVEITKGIKFVIGRLKRDEQQPTNFVQNYARHPRGLRHDEGQAYVNNVTRLALQHATRAMQPHLRAVQEVIANAASPEDLRRNLKRLAREIQHGSLEELIKNSRLMAHMAGRTVEVNEVKAK